MKPLAALTGFTGALVLIWGLTYHELIFTAFFAPKFEDVRRDAFEQSKSYRAGVIKELQNMQFEYEKADSAHRLGLANLIRRRAAEYPGPLPADLANFLATLP